MLKIRNLSKKYGKDVVLKNISLTINKGHIVGVIGANGTGKSTLLKILATEIEDYDGDILFNGKNIRGNLKEIRKRIGYVPQNPTLFEELTVKDNIEFWKDKNEIDLVNKLIDILELKEWLKKKEKNLSGGTKNRINILVGIINNPNIIILDEPLVGVALSIKKKFFEFIRELSKQGKIILMSSHELWEIELVCTDVLIIKENEVSSFRTVLDIKNICKEKNIGFWDYLSMEGGL